MPARVPRIPPGLTTGEVVNGRSVRGGVTWQRAAELSNWLNGRGGVLIPAFAPRIVVPLGATRTFRFNVYPRFASIARVWNVVLAATTELTGIGLATIKAGGGSPITRSVGDSDSRSTAIQYIEELGAQSSTEGEATLEITASTILSTIRVDGICCYEVPRFVLLPSASENAADVESCRPGEAIYHGSEVSVRGVVDGIVAARLNAKRNGLFQWGVPDEDAITTSSTTFAPLFILNPSVLGRVHFAGDTLVASSIRTRARATTQDGEVRFTAVRSGASKTITVKAGAGWGYWPSGASDSLDIDAEDLTTSDGRRGAAWEELLVEIRAKTAGGTLDVASVCCGSSGVA